MRTRIAVSLAAALLAAGTAAAQTAAPNAQEGSRKSMVDRIDANHDGTVTKAEYQAFVDRRFERLDTNHDGYIDADEAAAHSGGRHSSKRGGMIQRLDANGDGKISKAEFEAGSMKRFERLSGGADSISDDQLDNALKQQHERHGAGHEDDAGSD